VQHAFSLTLTPNRGQEMWRFESTSVKVYRKERSNFRPRLSVLLSCPPFRLH